MNIEKLMEKIEEIIHDGRTRPFSRSATARAVLAIALAEAADEDAALTKGDLLLTAGEMTASELRTVRAVLDWRAARLRTLAAQLGGKTDA